MGEIRCTRSLRTRIQSKHRASGRTRGSVMAASAGVYEALYTQKSNTMQAEAEREKDRLKLLLDITNTLVSSLEPCDLLRAISASIRQGTHCDAVGLFMPDSE